MCVEARGHSGFGEGAGLPFLVGRGLTAGGPSAEASFCGRRRRWGKGCGDNTAAVPRPGVRGGDGGDARALPAPEPVKGTNGSQRGRKG